MNSLIAFPPYSKQPEEAGDVELVDSLYDIVAAVCLPVEQLVSQRSQSYPCHVDAHNAERKVLEIKFHQFDN